jgi:uncharacterized protein
MLEVKEMLELQTAPAEVAETIVPFHTFLWKIASRCNINCTYCFVYNSADSLWREQPRFMSEKIARQTALRIREHCEYHNKTDIAITFHGGEPLLGGLKHLRMLVSVIEEILPDLKIHLGMQSNGLLFTEEIGDFCLEKKIKIGISLDGPPEINDIYRVDHQGRPTSAKLEEKLKLITSPKYKNLFAGFLCVMNPEVDPIAVTDYLLSYAPYSFDLLFPLNHHSNPPIGKQQDINATPYGDWLIKSFDYWAAQKTETSIRIFRAIMNLLFNRPTLVESLGLSVVDLIVVEANGEIEAVDSLKSTYEGATKLGFNIFENDFNTVASHFAVRSRQKGAQSLCAKCQACPVVKVCGSGYVPHRYSTENGFDNPSVYCADLEKIIRHIHSYITRELALSQGTEKRHVA